MTTATKSTITVSTNVDAPLEKVWELFTTPKHITQWYNASPDWFSPRASNDLRVGGKFLTRMEAVDGSFGFDMEGVYLEIIPHEKFVYEMADGRKVTTTFETEGDKTIVTQEFDPEQTNPLEMQEFGWQSILNNFNKYVEYTKKYQPLSFKIDINVPRT
ncbi:MAG: SRPBCC domain-containing protein, partial [Flavitalea sp.]